VRSYVPLWRSAKLFFIQDKTLSLKAKINLLRNENSAISCENGHKKNQQRAPSPEGKLSQTIGSQLMSHASTLPSFLKKAIVC
jgi:hypothetical protein